MLKMVRCIRSPSRWYSGVLAAILVGWACPVGAQLSAAPTAIYFSGPLPILKANQAFVVSADLVFPDTATAYRCILDGAQVGMDLPPSSRVLTTVNGVTTATITCNYPGVAVGIHQIAVASVYVSPGVMTSRLLTAQATVGGIPGTGGSCAAGLWAGQYFGNLTLSGTALLQTCESTIMHNWGPASPGGSVPADSFSVRWVGTFTFTGGSTTFTVRTDDGARLWIDNVLIIDAWIDQSATTYMTTRTVTAGSHAMRVEYFEDTGDAVIEVSWTP